MIGVSHAHAAAVKDDGYFSKHLCDCGCGNLLPQRLYDLGWRYLKGHKAAGGPKVTKRDPVHNQGRAPAARVTALVNWEAVERFVNADLDARRARVRLIAERLPALEAEIEALRAEREALTKEIDERQLALAMLLPAKEGSAS